MRVKLRVVLDYDDTLVACNEEAIKRLNKEYGTSYTIYDIKEWGKMNSILDNRLKYYSDPEFVRTLPLMKGAREFVKKLSKMVEIFIMTSVPSNCAGVRVAHILENFPEISPSNIIIGGRKDLVKADIILDDGHHNLENSNVAYPVLFQQPWNYNKTGVLSVNGYDEFLQLVEIMISTSQKKLEKSEVVSLIGPTGSGKKELADALISTGKFKRVKTYTTKDDAENYHVLSFDEFIAYKESGLFSETSMYMGNFFGMMAQDVTNVMNENRIPLMILDINGAMSIQSHFNTLNVFVKSDKKDCIKSILLRNFPTDEAVQRIASLDAEFKNEELCDITVDSTDVDAVLKAIEQ